MKKPELKDFNLTERDLVVYSNQLEYRDKARKESIELRQSRFKFGSWSMIVIILLIGVFIAAGSENEDAWTILLSIVLFSILPISALMFKIGDMDISSDEAYKINRMVDRDLEERCRAYENAVKEYERYQKRIKVEFWNNLDGYQFEKEVAELFKNQGYYTHITPKSGDGGVDIILEKNGNKLAVQCKHHAKPVGPNDVRALMGVVASQGYTGGVFVSLNGYTDSVSDEVRRSLVAIQLMSLKDLLLMMDEDDSIRIDPPIEIDSPIEKPTQPNPPEEPPMPLSLFPFEIGDMVEHCTLPTQTNWGCGTIIYIDRTREYFVVEFDSGWHEFLFSAVQTGIIRILR